MPRIAIGEFNEVTRSNEKIGGRRANRNRNNKFLIYSDCCGLMDIVLLNLFLPGCHHDQDTLILERLDNACCNHSYRAKFAKACLSHLRRLLSDHAPIILDLNPQRD